MDPKLKPHEQHKKHPAIVICCIQFHVWLMLFFVCCPSRTKVCQQWLCCCGWNTPCWCAVDQQCLRSNTWEDQLPVGTTVFKDNGSQTISHFSHGVWEQDWGMTQVFHGGCCSLRRGTQCFQGLQHQCSCPQVGISLPRPMLWKELETKKTPLGMWCFHRCSHLAEKVWTGLARGRSPLPIMFSACNCFRGFEERDTKKERCHCSSQASSIGQRRKQQWRSQIAQVQASRTQRQNYVLCNAWSNCEELWMVWQRLQLNWSFTGVPLRSTKKLWLLSFLLMSHVRNNNSSAVIVNRNSSLGVIVIIQPLCPLEVIRWKWWMELSWALFCGLTSKDILSIQFIDIQNNHLGDQQVEQGPLEKLGSKVDNMDERCAISPVIRLDSRW